MKNRHVALLPSVALLLALAACSGGGGGGGGDEGPVPDAELAPPAATMLVPAAPGSAPIAANVAAVPPGAAWYADPVTTRVWDPALGPLDELDRILAGLAQSGLTELLSEPAYRAQIDARVLDAPRARDGARDTRGESFGAEAGAHELWTARTGRASGSAPADLDLWAPGTSLFRDETRFVRGAIERGASALDPFGELALDWAVAPAPSSVSTPSAAGTLRCERPEKDRYALRYHQTVGDVTRAVGPGGFAERVQAHLSLASDLTSGLAHVFRTRRFDDGGREVVEPRQYLVAWGGAHLFRATDGVVGTSYRRSAPLEHALRYKLYRAVAPRAGARVEPGTGFGFVTQGGAYGWADAFGVQVDGTLPAEGELVTRALPAVAGEDETYTVVRAPGRLFRCARSEVPLAAARAHDFLWRVFEPGLGRAVLYRVRYEHDDMLAADAWLRVAVFDDVAREFTALAPEEPIDTAARGHLALWCDDLGGMVSFLDGDPVLGLWAPEPVDGDDAAFGAGQELALLGFVDVLASEIDTLSAEAGDVWLPPAPDVGTPYRFVFERASLALLYDVDGSGTDLHAVGLAPGAEPKSGLFAWGFRGGPLLDAASAAALTEPRDAWRADEIYVWETGANPWNELFALVDEFGGFVELPRPVRFVYVHARASDRNSDGGHAGETFVLRYHGPGDLRGIPFEPRDLDGDLEPDRVLPRFSLRDGALVGPTGAEYLARAIAIEQTLVPEAENPGGLSLVPASDLVVPGGLEHVSPTIGRDPASDELPRVIDGVVLGG